MTPIDRPPRILFVAMASSVHTARWISQLAGEGWDLHLFPSSSFRPHPLLREVTVHGFRMPRPRGLDRSVRLRGPVWPLPSAKGVGRVMRFLPSWRRVPRLVRLIRRLKPDIVHSIEIQHAGYLVLEARQRLGGLPPWVVTTWGSDTRLFAHQPEHADRTRAVLEACDYIDAECRRDIDDARSLGFTGDALPVLPNAGGIDLDRAEQLRQPGPTSQRRLVLLKGYQHEAGRALVGLEAIDRCAPALAGHRVAIYLASPEVEARAAEVARSSGVPIDIVGRVPHDEMLRLHGRARVSIGLSISDAASTSFLEAIAMGSFPIQSSTACADEWVEDGFGGLLVDPEDPAGVAEALRRALTDDALVDGAAAANRPVVLARLEAEAVRSQAVAAYRVVIERASGSSESGNRVGDARQVLGRQRRIDGQGEDPTEGV